MLSRFVLLILLAVSSLLGVSAFAKEPFKEEGCWEVGLSFGEIPILAGSFKPAFSVGYKFNEHFRVKMVMQQDDYLHRNQSSFNAQNTGLTGLQSSREHTGMRFFMGFDYRPTKWSPYISAGIVIDRDDVETMRFDHRERTIGDGTYTSEVKVVQTRKAGWGPAFGLGYDVPVNDRASYNIGMAMVLFGAMPVPEVEIHSDSPLSPEDEEALRRDIREQFKSNFHNHYHIFNLGLTYKFRGGK